MKVLTITANRNRYNILKTSHTTSGGVLFFCQLPETGFGAIFWQMPMYYYECNTPLNFNTNTLLTWFCIDEAPSVFFISTMEAPRLPYNLMMKTE